MTDRRRTLLARDWQAAVHGELNRADQGPAPES